MLRQLSVSLIGFVFTSLGGCIMINQIYFCTAESLLFVL